jgi:hypothetical protein
MALPDGTEGNQELDLAPANWLIQTTRQIQVIDYEVHATLRVIAAGGRLDSAQRTAFVAASSQRARLMARIETPVQASSIDRSYAGCARRAEKRTSGRFGVSAARYEGFGLVTARQGH